MLNYRHLLAMLIATSLYTNANAAALTGCAAKRQIVADKISIAEGHNNLRQAAALRRALQDIEIHCTDDELQRKRQRKIAKARLKLEKREADLLEAQRTGNSKKIAKSAAKLDRAKRNLERAEEELQR